MLADAGKRVRFRLLTGEDERKLPALQRSAPDKLLSAVLATRHQLDVPVVVEQLWSCASACRG
jgi:hypothetical protein